MRSSTAAARPSSGTSACRALVPPLPPSLPPTAHVSPTHPRTQNIRAQTHPHTHALFNTHTHAPNSHKKISPRDNNNNNNRRIPDFPFISGVSVIVASWFVSPLLAGVMAYALFWVLRVLVLRSKNSAVRSIYVLPILLFVTIFVNLFFIL